ncbi:MAG: hypothetical protein LBG59_03900 [Candidatus Peribacteria bacterium]|nr:hypothetical protein [Candidatus Peribacteria bacterium]
MTRGELASLFVYMFQLSEREITPNENSIENSSTGALSSTSTEEKAGSKSRRETFQELMKVQ